MYLVTTFYNGPSLEKFYNHILSEKQIKFISACIIQSLKYIREKHIIHRDVTITNIVMDKDDYFNLIDFSFSIEYSQRLFKYLKCNINKITTPPEILKNSDYNYNSDYYNLGNIIFFLVFKKYPWDIPNNVDRRKNLTELIESCYFNQTYSFNLYDFIEKLIIIDPKKRLGYNSIDELMTHPWFNDFNWIYLEKKKIISPFSHITIINSNKCNKFDKTYKMVEKYKLYSSKEKHQILLKNFEFSKNVFVNIKA